MDGALLAVLNDTERLLVAETEPQALSELDEDATVALRDCLTNGVSGLDTPVV